MIARRSLLAIIPLVAMPGLVRAAPDDAMQDRLAALEARSGGRLGAAILSGGRLVGYRADELFPICSTYKILAAALVLHRVDRGEEDLGRRVTYGRDDLVDYSPATAPHAGTDGMTISELCSAAVTLSDNTAGNLLLDSVGGPAALTAYLRSLGDHTTRLDRREPDLNHVEPGEQRDTTSPSAMAATLQRLVLGSALSPASRDQAMAWLVGCQTGAQRLRAGVPQGWRVGDKTGSGEDHATNDVAVILPPDRPPVTAVAFLIGSPASDADRNATLAGIGRLASAM